ncbi:helix-turn-helix transcriptional regulator [Pirellulales bacterium]|nr:helix-turn-helix transcriptional regulator [Pirellulales bacterium]
MAMQRKKFSDQIRQAIADSGQTRYRISVESGINEAALGKFFHGERGLSLESLDKLAAHLGLRVVMDRKPKKGK